MNGCVSIVAEGCGLGVAWVIGCFFRADADSWRGEQSANVLDHHEVRLQHLDRGRHVCAHSPERVPGARPARLPTVEMSWQGNPPQRMPTGGTSRQSIVVASPRFEASGQWWAKTRATGSLTSENQTV